MKHRQLAARIGSGLLGCLVIGSCVSKEPTDSALPSSAPCSEETPEARNSVLRLLELEAETLGTIDPNNLVPIHDRWICEELGLRVQEVYDIDGPGSQYIPTYYLADGAGLMFVDLVLREVVELQSVPPGEPRQRFFGWGTVLVYDSDFNLLGTYLI